MGTFRRVPLWILLVLLAPLNAQEYGDYSVDETADYSIDESSQEQQQQQVKQQVKQHVNEPTILLTGPPRISVIPVAAHTVVRAINTAHNNRVCSTWGNFHFKNFDGDIFYFPGTCNYIYASHCKGVYEDFNIQIRRTVVDGVPVIEKISMKIDGLVVQIDHNTVSVNGNDVQLPFSGSGIQIEKHGVYLSVTSKLGLVFMWNDDDSLLLELDEKYANQTCGLCGDFNGISIHNEFISNGIQITEAQFGNLQKLDGPTELCNDVPPTPKSNCTDYENICSSILLGSAFSKCHSLVAVEQYIEACVQDLCRCDSKNTALCLCNTFAEYSRQCAHAGGKPENWRTKDLCPKTCPYNMQYQECGSPCPDTCSNPERSLLCENHCLEGCFCPPGTVFDDINNFGCIPLDNCSCTFNSNSYVAGTSYSTICSTCVCSGGKWSCNDLPCPSTCSIDGGSHITTYDQSHYDIHGDCNYVLTKDCKGLSFIVLTELRKCGLTESETCLKSATIILNGGETIIVIKPCGSVFINSVYTRLPVSAANVTIFRPSSFYIVLKTTLGVQVVAQLTPFMQVYVALDPSYKGQTCGLCGNFNDKQTDDFQTLSGVIEGTAASFANTWKTQADCANVKNVYEDPCSLSVENEKYAQHWCGLISDPSGPFASCHATVNPEVYQKNCMFDTCNCEKSEECMCASLSSYVRACATKGVIVSGWRSTVCSKYMHNCPKTLSYTYSTSTCQPTCRSLSEPDVTCDVKFTPVDGCTCAKGLYMDDSGKCIPAEACPCYFKGSAVPSGEVVHENGIMCTCSQGKLNCIGTVKPACTAPMVYFDCKNASVGTKGAECQKSCQTLDMACYSAKCVSGCVCPAGLVSDGKGSCIQEEQCPCIHNDATYQPGEKIEMKCNTCTCKDRMWQCTNNPCLGTCAVYGDGHYITFDGKRYSFSGDCEYTLAQDHCGKGGNSSTFRVITENIPCGTTGTTCSKSIKVFLESYELILTEEHIEVVERGIGGVAPYKVRHMGIYLVIEADNGLILMWDRKTSIFIKLSKDFEGQVCGLCGNYDGNGNNDFTTRSMSVVGDVNEFGNSWKISSTCPDAKQPKDACSVNPYRKSWAQKQCSIINSDVFSACHARVDPSKYYDDCVTDSCACDSGGDCECFCTAVAAYAQACGESGACVSWRSPNICPLFCDYYNPEGECEWHYKPCGAPCMKTCRNPSGKCMHELSGLEGCYPSCPAAKPFFDDDDMECVAQCGCYDDEENHYKVGQLVPSKENCKTCSCSRSGIQCKYQKEACHCEYQGKMYKYNDVIYNTTDGTGGCISAICKENGTIYRDIHHCHVSTTTPFTFTSTHLSSTTTGTTVSLTTICVKEVCQWSQWFDASYPKPGMENGDFDTYQNIKAKGFSICSHPKDIQCRAQMFPDTPLAELEQNVQCNVSFGLICLNKNQLPPICYNYNIRVLCCRFERCDLPTPSTAPTTAKPSTTLSTTTKKTVPTTSPPATTVTETSSPTTVVSTTTSGVPTTGVCHPKCTWTKWIDVHIPGVGKNEGDFETYDKIRDLGHKLCPKPDGIQCRSEKYPEVPIGRIGQVVQCNLTFGLVCKNEDQEGDFKVCLNYQIKVLCCDDYSHCATTTPGSTSTLPTTTETTTPSTTITTITTTTPLITTTPNIPTTSTTVSSPETTPTTETSTTPETTISLTTTSTTTSATTETTTTRTTTPETTTSLTTTTTPETTTTPLTTETRTPFGTMPDITTVTTPPETTTSLTTTTSTTFTTTPETSTSPTTTTTTTTETPETTQTTTTSPSTTTTSTTTTTKSTTTSTPTTPEKTTTPEPTTTTTTETPKTTVPTTTPQSTVIIKTFTTTKPTPNKVEVDTTTVCQPQCKWSDWIDVDFPKPGIDGGDKETFQNIMANGKNTCKNPQNITCRAEDYPGISIDNIGQKVQCDITIGLVCNNKDQTGIVKQCYNYQIKVLCCDDYSHCSTTPPQTTPTTTSTTTTTVPPTTTETTTTTTTESTTTETPKPTTTTTTTETPTTIITTTPVPPTTTETTTTTTISTTESTTTETPKPTTTTTETPTTQIPICTPKCKWSHWIDVDTPTSGIDGGDKETFKNIMSKGKEICKHPKDIECRAEDFPDISIDNVGQIVQCDSNVGLVCNNKDQTGKVKQCYNYQIKVLCCDDYSHCSTTPPQTTPTTTSTTTTTTPVPPTTTETTTTTTISTTESTTETPKPITTTIPTQTTKCFCHVDHKYFTPGEIIYNKTDAAGCSFYAVCNDFCEAERFTGPCTTTKHPKTKCSTTVKPSTTTPSPSTTPEKRTTTTTTTTIVTTPRIQGCPPHKTNETWIINNCTKATCHGNNVITIEPVSCPKLEPLNCANGFPPVKKMSADGCCEHYECQCVCSGWGDPHYITFDGTYYTFLDNCTYVLVQQITPKYDNFRVLVDNYFCDAEDGLSCPQSIMIYYKSNEIVLTRMMFQGRMRNRIRFNQDWVTPGFTKDGIIISSAGINMNVEIPEIDAFISFSGLIFVVKLPFSKFAYNTEGQCGTCSNNSTEDCRMPSGEIVKDCSKMADHWKVNVTGKPYCKPPQPTEPPSHPTPAPTCKPSALCDIILSEVFAACHKIIPPKPYHEGCTYDSCRIPTDSVECSSLEIYASLCAANGVCIDWRDKTKGRCPFNCPSGKVYDACGPIHPKTCGTKEVQELNKAYTEGCFCPKGTMLFNSYTDVCVESCSCTGPDGMPKGPGETWTSNCNNCMCEKNSLTVQCHPITCPPLVDLSCHKEGLIPMELPDPHQPCCMKNECICNSSNCLQKEKNCSLGFEAVPVLLEGDCCPSYECRPTEVCVFKGSTYQPGDIIPQSKGVCKNCVCTNQTDPENSLRLMSCNPIECHTECEAGYELISSEGECCGTCKPNACKIKLSDNSIKILKSEDTWSPPDQPCVEYECHIIEDQYVPVEVRRTCPIEECDIGYQYKIKKGECCGTCIPYACVIHLRDNTTKTLKPEEQYTPPEEKCTTYTCSNTFDVEKTSITCPLFDRSNCLEGTIKSDGCCQSCESALKGCQVHKKSQRIKTSICESEQVVELSYCGGACMTSSMYSAEANMMEHKCSCCQEVKTSKREINLKCLDGTSTVQTYIYAEECGCTHTECESDTQTSSSQLRQQVKTKQEINEDQQIQQTN